jgi:hypothetical protein
MTETTQDNQNRRHRCSIIKCCWMEWIACSSLQQLSAGCYSALLRVHHHSHVSQVSLITMAGPGTLPVLSQGCNSLRLHTADAPKENATFPSLFNLSGS